MAGRSHPAGCLDDTVVSRLAHGETLPEELEATARDHLRRCPTCEARLARERESADFVRWARDRLVERRPVESAPPPSSPGMEDDQLESALHGYTLLEEISRGGQATVHRARQDRTGRLTAMKVIRTRSTRERARLAREAELASRLRHPSIVTVYDCGLLPDGAFAIAMELIDGTPLDAWSRQVDQAERSARRTRRRKLLVAATICDAVAHANRLGVIHRDLKPGNILVDRRDVPHVLDFGVAHEVSGTRAPITRTGEFAGTITYASPEQLAPTSGPLDVRTDVYSMGVVIFELMTGVLPFDAEGSLVETARRITEEPPRHPSTTGGHTVDRDLWTILSRALSKDPERRYPSTEALGDDLRRLLDGRPIDARRDSTVYVLGKLAQRHRSLTAVLALLLVSMLATTAVLLVSHGAVSRARSAADRTAARLADALRESTLARGMDLAAGGDTVQAERILWQEVLDPSSPQAVDADPTSFEFQAGLWALRELARSSPCLASSMVAGGPAVLAFDRRDGEILVATYDGAVRRLDDEDLSIRGRWSVPALAPCGPLTTITLDPVRSRLAAVYAEGHAVIVHDGEGGAVLGSFESDDDDRISALAFDEQGGLLLQATSGTITRLHPETFEVASTTTGLPPGVTGGRLALAADELAYSGLDGSIVRADPASGIVLERILREGWVASSARPLALTGDGSLLFNDGTLVLRRAGESEERSLLAGRDSLKHIRVSPDDRTVAAWRRTGPVMVRPLAASDDDPLPLAGHPASGGDGPSDGAFSPDGTRLATVGLAGGVRLWRTTGPNDVRSTAAHEGALHTIRSTADGVLTVGADRRVCRSRGDSTDHHATIPTEGDVVFAAISPDGALVATEERSPARSRVHVRRLDTMRDVVPPIECAIYGGPFTFGADGRVLIAGAGPGRVALVDCESEEVRFLDSSSERDLWRAFRIDPTGRRVACGTTGGLLYVTSLDAPALTEPIRTSASIRSLAFSPDGRWLLVGLEDGRLELREGATGAFLGEALVHDHWPMAIACSPDGTVVASASYAGDVRITSLPSLRPLGRRRFDGTPLHALEFSADGATVLAGDDLGRLHTWTIDAHDASIARNVQFWTEVLMQEERPVPNGPAMRRWAARVTGERDAADAPVWTHAAEE